MVVHVPGKQQNLFEAFNINVKKINKKKKEKKGENNKQDTSIGEKITSTNKTKSSEKNNESIDVSELTRKGTSVEVDAIYRDIRDGPDVRVITKIMFSEEVDIKEPNIAELRKISLVDE